MTEHKRKHDPWKTLPPRRLEDVRPCDLVICRECWAVRYVGELGLEKRDPGLFEKIVEGVFCPGCGQLLFDRNGWIQHQVEQRHWDEQVANRSGKPGPLVVAAAVDGSPD